MSRASTKQQTDRRLSRRFYRRDPVALSQALLGRTLVRILDDGTRLSGRIVEVEAYLGIPDKAAHTYNGKRTQRNESMYLDAGHAYVYFTYGMHYCLNVTADRAETPTACLIRALRPMEGLGLMRRLRSGKIPQHRLKDTNLCSGPAKLAQALAIDRSLDGADLTRAESLYLTRGQPARKGDVVSGPRVGVHYAEEWAEASLRFYVEGDPNVSRR